MTNFDLKTLGLADGDYEITVVARADGYLPSPPSNAVQYVVGEETQDELQGTWLWKTFLPDIVGYGNIETYEVNFTSNDINYTRLDVCGVEYAYMELTRLNYNDTMALYAYDWKNENYFYITITDTLQEVRERNGANQAERLLQILQDNATKLTEGQGHIVQVYSSDNVGSPVATNISIYDGIGVSDNLLAISTEWTGRISSGYITIVFPENDIDIFSEKGANYELISTDNLGNNIVCTYKISGSCILSVEYLCFVQGTQITLANGNTKAVEDVTYDDELLVWDFYNGKYATAKPFWIMRPAVARYYYNITLSNGNTIKLVGSGGNCHRVFSVTQNKFIYATQCVGDDIYTENGIFKLVSCERVDEVVNYYNLKTEKYHNCFANGILTCGRYGNIYDIADMKYCSDIPNFTDEELAEREVHWERLRLPK